MPRKDRQGQGIPHVREGDRIKADGFNALIDGVNGQGSIDNSYHSTKVPVCDADCNGLDSGPLQYSIQAIPDNTKQDFGALQVYDFKTATHKAPSASDLFFYKDISTNKICYCRLGDIDEGISSSESSDEEIYFATIEVVTDVTYNVATGELKQTKTPLTVLRTGTETVYLITTAQEC